MQKQIERTRTRLKELTAEILTPTFGAGESVREWGGADVVISVHAPEPTAGGFYPEPRYVVTPHAKPLSQLFYDLRDAFNGLIDSCSKIEFYGRLALTALNYQQDLDESPEKKEDLLKAVLLEATAMLAQMEKGDFQFLMVAPGGIIWADLVDRAERNGYLGIDATREFFAEMEQRHHDA